MGVATEFYLDRPPVPLFTPRMPAKENCKSTQIYDGDYELFDFNREVEPMLNTLIEKTLEQAQMEVLEEYELSLIEAQSKEYQEVRNAELIEAQRMEAAEDRIAQEISRRGVQQRARKAERRAAHQKHCCRVVSKVFLDGLREDAISHMNALSVMPCATEVQINEKVLPWLYEKVQMFIEIDAQINQNAHEMVEFGVRA